MFTWDELRLGGLFGILSEICLHFGPQLDKRMFVELQGTTSGPPPSKAPTPPPSPHFASKGGLVGPLFFWRKSRGQPPATPEASPEPPREVWVEPSLRGLRCGVCRGGGPLFSPRQKSREAACPGITTTNVSLGRA